MFSLVYFSNDGVVRFWKSFWPWFIIFQKNSNCIIGWYIIGIQILFNL